MNVLLVEDDPGIGRFVSRGLAARDYRVTWERDGSQVASLLGSGRFVAALLDLGLPDGDGLTLCRDLRDEGIDTPVLMLTARGALQDRLDGFACGADDYLPKPFAFDELLARLAAIVRRKPAHGAEPLRFHTMSVDRDRRAVMIGDRPLILSHREFDLLLALAAATGNVVARDALAASVWGDGAEVSDNALDVYIGYLRKRLGEAPGAPAIETLRGRGFRLAPPA